jgi:hypothetical protein
MFHTIQVDTHIIQAIVQGVRTHAAGDLWRLQQPVTYEPTGLDLRPEKIWAARMCVHAVGKKLWHDWQEYHRAISYSRNNKPYN